MSIMVCQKKGINMYRLITDRRKAVKEWRKKHPKELAAQRKRWREKHPDYNRLWKLANPDRVKLYKKREKRKRK